MPQLFSNLRQSIPRRKRYIYTKNIREFQLQRRYTMRLSMFAFWTALIGFVLIALTAIPGSEIPILSGKNHMPLIIGFILFIGGVSAHVVNNKIEEERRDTEDSISSIWRRTDELSDEIRNSEKELANDLHRRIDDVSNERWEGERTMSNDLHRRIDDLSDHLYRELERCQNSCSRKQNSCMNEDSVVARSGLAAKTMGN